MAIVQPTPVGKLRIDLAGPDGNAFALLAYARCFGKQLGLDFKAIQAEMQSADYKHLVTTFDKNFGHVVDLVLPQGGLQ